MVNSEQELREALAELEAAVGRLNAAMLRASYAGVNAGTLSRMTGLSLGRVWRNIRLQQKGKP